MKVVNVTVKWKNGFSMAYVFEYATPKRISNLQAHYDSLSWVESVQFGKVQTV